MAQITTVQISTLLYPTVRPLEVYNTRFWHTLFIHNFKINKKAYLQTLKFLSTLPNISMTPFILKNNHVKKAYMQILNIPMTSFILKIKKAHTQTPNVSLTHSY